MWPFLFYTILHVHEGIPPAVLFVCQLKLIKIEIQFWHCNLVNFFYEQSFMKECILCFKLHITMQLFTVVPSSTCHMTDTQSDSFSVTTVAGVECGGCYKPGQTFLPIKVGHYLYNKYIHAISRLCWWTWASMLRSLSSQISDFNRLFILSMLTIDISLKYYNMIQIYYFSRFFVL